MSRRNLLAVFVGICLLPMASVVTFAGVALYFRVEQEKRSHYVPWEEKQAISFAKQARPFEALVTVHRLRRSVIDYRTPVLWRVIRILVLGGHESAIRQYQRQHRSKSGGEWSGGSAAGLEVKMAAVQAELGRTEDAAETIARMELPGERYRAMKSVATILAIKGKNIEAVAFARRIPLPGSRAQALIEIARVLNRKGKLRHAGELAEEALANANRLSRDDDARDYSIRDVTELFANLGETARAVALAETVRDDEIRGYALETIAETLARAGDIEPARNIVMRITQEDAQSYALREVMHIQLGQGDAAGAMRTARLASSRKRHIDVISGAAFDWLLDFQFEKWNSGIAETLLAFMELSENEGNQMDPFRVCVLGHALAAADIGMASRVWSDISDPSQRPAFWEMTQNLLYGRPFCRAIA